MSFVDDAVDYDGERDTMLTKGAPDKNWGSLTNLYVTGDPNRTGVEQEALLRWDLSGVVSPTTTVCRAEIQLYVTDPGTDYLVNVVSRPWAFNQATWNRATATDPWEEPGAKGVSDRGQIIGSIQVDPFAGSGVMTKFQIGVGAVQSWINDPTQNNGIIITQWPIADRLVFANHNWSTPLVNRPTLVLTVPGP